MFKKIVESIDYPTWAKNQKRYVRLDSLDRALDGTLYDHLRHSFYEEVDYNKKYIPIEERRPSAQTNLPSMVAKMLARKLFAGRHAPRVTHESAPCEEWLRDLVSHTALYERMLQASVWGSVGSVGVTFRIVDNALHIDVWRSKYCYPEFKPDGDLSRLRVQYTTGGRELRAKGFTVDCLGEAIAPGDNYWFIRDWTAETELTYIPIPESRYDPLDGPTDDAVIPRVHEDSTITHGLGYVPGVWMVNLSGGAAPDGVCTWEPALSIAIDTDYTLSQLGRGVRYNAAPQLVIIGDLVTDDDNRIQRGPVTVIQLKSQTRDADGGAYGGGDAKLLEMVGNGTTAGMKYVEYARRLALESIAVSRKNPEEARGTLSGRAMELMDDSFYDLVHELRNAYGEGGFGPLLRKIATAYVLKKLAPEGITQDMVRTFGLRWPRLYAPSPQDEMTVIEGMTMATQNALIEPDVAKSYLRVQLDLEDYKRSTPIVEGADAEGEGDPAPGDAPPEADKYNEGKNTDLRRPGPQGHTLPTRTVGKRQTTLD